MARNSLAMLLAMALIAGLGARSAQAQPQGATKTTAPPAPVPPPAPAPAADDCGGAAVSQYNRPLAIASIFMVMAVSVAGFLAPSLMRRAGGGTRVGVVAASAMGTGVILAVSLVHILADAEAALSSPCLPTAWLEAFPNWGVLFCTITIIGMVVMDFLLQGVFERRYAAAQDAPVNKAVSTTSALSLAPACHSMTFGAAGSGPSSLPEGKGGSAADFSRAAAPLPPLAAKAANSDADAAEVGGAFGDGHCHGGGGAAGVPARISEAGALALKRGAVMFIEGSVCTHSVPVGLALGLQGEDTFASLLVAIIVHQVLEGLGVGAAAADAQYSGRELYLLAAGFGLTAPLGIALGVGLHSVVRETDPAYLLSLGVVNAIAAGMLLYVAIEHMNAIGSQGPWLRAQRPAVQALVIACFCAGGAAMIGIGKFA